MVASLQCFRVRYKAALVTTGLKLLECVMDAGLGTNSWSHTIPGEAQWNLIN